MDPHARMMDLDAQFEQSNTKLKKQFRITLYENEILITTEKNTKDGFSAGVNLPKDKQIRLIDKYESRHNWLETKENELNYYHCCGILFLFGITPPSFEALCKHLHIK